MGSAPKKGAPRAWGSAILLGLPTSAADPSPHDQSGSVRGAVSGRQGLPKLPRRGRSRDPPSAARPEEPSLAVQLKVRTAPAVSVAVPGADRVWRRRTTPRGQTDHEGGPSTGARAATAAEPIQGAGAKLDGLSSGPGANDKSGLPAAAAAGIAVASAGQGVSSRAPAPAAGEGQPKGKRKPRSARPAATATKLPLLAAGGPEVEQISRTGGGTSGRVRQKYAPSRPKRPAAAAQLAVHLPADAPPAGARRDHTLELSARVDGPLKGSRAPAAAAAAPAAPPNIPGGILRQRPSSFRAEAVPLRSNDATGAASLAPKSRLPPRGASERAQGRRKSAAELQIDGISLFVSGLGPAAGSAAPLPLETNSGAPIATEGKRSRRSQEGSMRRSSPRVAEDRPSSFRGGDRQPRQREAGRRPLHAAQTNDGESDKRIQAVYERNMAEVRLQKVMRVVRNALTRGRKGNCCVAEPSSLRAPAAQTPALWFCLHDVSVALTSAPGGAGGAAHRLGPARMVHIRLWKPHLHLSAARPGSADTAHYMRRSALRSFLCCAVLLFL